MHKNSYNKVFLIGHLGGKPEGKYTKSGRSSASFSIATNETWKDKEGKLRDHVEWHNIVAWDRLADFANEYLYKGQLVSVDGILRTQKWTAKDGSARKTTEVVCSNIIPLEWKEK